MAKQNHFGEPFRDDLGALVPYHQKKKGRLPTAKPLRPSKPVVSRGKDTAAVAATEGGIQSPLTEVGPRSYASPQILTSTDGLFVMVFQPLASTRFQDGAGDIVTVNYDT